jgi:hypothetical protein
MTRRIRHALLPLLLLVGCKAECQAGNLEAGKPAAEPVRPGVTLCSRVVDQRCRDATDRFTEDVREIHAVLVIPNAPRASGKATVVWIAEETGGVAPPNYKIAEKELDLSGQDPKATHATITGSLSRPTKGWPVGKYRVEFHIGGAAAASGAFQIAAAASR